MCSSRLLSTLALLLFSPSLLAQDRPDLTGRWTSSSAGRLWLEFSQEDSRVVIQSPITVAGEQRANRFVYALDGSESRNEFLTASGAVWDEVAQARWVGGAIVVTQQTLSNEGWSYESMTTYYIDPDGQLVRSGLSGVLNGPEHSMMNSVMTFQRE